MIGSARPFVYTSGTGVLSIETRDGHWRQENSAEDDPYEPRHWLSIASTRRTVIRRRRRTRDPQHRCPPAPGLGRGGQQADTGDLRIGRENAGAPATWVRGLNLYSHVHVDDLAELLQARARARRAGALYHGVAAK
jgi:hypothetical protein